MVLTAGHLRGQGRKPTIDLDLRTPHINYLERLAEQTGVSLSDAFGMVIEKNAALALLTYKPPRKEKKHFTISSENAEILEKLAVRGGLFKADIARRLIDEEIASDRALGG